MSPTIETVPTGSLACPTTGANATAHPRPLGAGRFASTPRCAVGGRVGSRAIAAWPAIAVGLVVVGWSSLGWAADPAIGRVTPYGGRRGVEVDVVFTGARLADAQEVMLYDSGIRAVNVAPQRDGSVKARLAIAADCRLGRHAVRLRTATGISNLLTFSVGVLPEIQEVEPNSEFQNPQKIPLNVTVNGTIENEDVDYFAVEAKKGQRISAEVEGIRLGQEFFDPYVAILDTGRFVLAGSDDTPLVKQDSVAAAIAPADGTYIIQVRESAFGGNGNCRYRLHVGTFPRPLAVYPAGGRPGETLEVQWLGDPAGAFRERVTVANDAPADFALVAHDAGGMAPSANPFRVTNLPNVFEAEPNDDAAHATIFTAPAACNGMIEKPGDVDGFKFTAKAGQTFDIRVHARSIRSPLDSVLFIARSNGATVAGNDDSDTPDSYLRFTAPADDQYVLSVQDHLKQGGPEYVYRMEVSPISPRLTLGLPERAQYVDVVAPVPAGNRLALLVSAQREDFGGPLQWELKNLPAGVSAEIVPMTQDDGLTPVLFKAVPGAKTAGALVDLVGRHTADHRTLQGRLRQRTSLVRGQNNIEMVNHYCDRLAASVATAVPFEVEILEPKVPLVQNGTLELKVVATRQSGYKAPINLAMLFNPPGVSGPSVVTIPEGQSEAIFPLTADGGAAVRKWKVALVAQAAVGDGTATVSTSLANLEVAPPFFTFAFTTATVDQGQPTDLLVKIDKKRDFPGTARVELLGLPNEVTALPKEFAQDAKELIFSLKTTKHSPVGQHKALLCRAVVTLQGQPVTHLLGTGELRIQQPLPPKAAAPAAPPPIAQAPKAEPVKPRALSRLEQLRLEKSKPVEKK